MMHRHHKLSDNNIGRTIMSKTRVINIPVVPLTKKKGILAKIVNQEVRWIEILKGQT